RRGARHRHGAHAAGVVTHARSEFHLPNSGGTHDEAPVTATGASLRGGSFRARALPCATCVPVCESAMDGVLADRKRVCFVPVCESAMDGVLADRKRVC